MYYCANSNIGVATSSSPTGPFTDALGHALITQLQYINANTIDPCAFIDDDGQAYLYYGNTHCGVVKLNSDMISLNGTPKEITPTSFQEASNVVKRNGKYYLTYSLNGTDNANYCVDAASSTSPMGPFTKQATTILSQNASAGIYCTGSSSIFKIPSRDEWYIAYHRFIIPGGDGKHREVCINRLYFNSDGTIAAVVPTRAGITSPVSP
jgi:beta-xylosidase